MREIALTKGFKAMVDDDIFHLLENVPFHAACYRNNLVYARSNRTLLAGKPNTFLHWIVLAPSPHKSFQIRFKDGNTLNCQRYNLEYVEKTVNTQNHSKGQYGRKKSSEYIGVSYDTEIKRNRTKKWNAVLKGNGKVHRLGRFLTEEEAAIAYNNKAIELFGEKARLNKIITSK